MDTARTMNTFNELMELSRRLAKVSLDLTEQLNADRREQEDAELLQRERNLTEDINVMEDGIRSLEYDINAAIIRRNKLQSDIANTLIYNADTEQHRDEIAMKICRLREDRTSSLQELDDLRRHFNMLDMLLAKNRAALADMHRDLDAVVHDINDKKSKRNEDLDELAALRADRDDVHREWMKTHSTEMA